MPVTLLSGMRTVIPQVDSQGPLVLAQRKEVQAAIRSFLEHGWTTMHSQLIPVKVSVCNYPVIAIDAHRPCLEQRGAAESLWRKRPYRVGLQRKKTGKQETYRQHGLISEPQEINQELGGGGADATRRTTCAIFGAAGLSGRFVAWLTTSSTVPPPLL